MRTLFHGLVLLVAGTSSAAVAAAGCDPLPASTPLPISINGYTVDALSAGSKVSDSAGVIDLNGGLSVMFQSAHASTILTFLGGSFGDVQVNAPGAPVPSTTVQVPHTVGMAKVAAVDTRGAKALTLQAVHNEGQLAAICSLD